MACLDAAIGKAQLGGRAAFPMELRSRPFTLVHGARLPPANVLVARIRSVEWCLWCFRTGRRLGWARAPQELEQFMISYTQPKVCAAIEREAVAKYRVSTHVSIGDGWRTP